MQTRIGCVVALGLIAATADLGAAPITYRGQLFNVTPITDTIPDNLGNYYDPDAANYYSFYATAGSAVNIRGTRLDFDFDPAFFVHTGLFADTAAFGGDLRVGALDFADDEIPHPGPFGDPDSNFLAPVTGFYTVAFVDYLSGTDLGSNQLWDYSLVARGVSGVPEPGALGLVGLGIAAAFLMRRRRRL